MGEGFGVILRQHLARKGYSQAYLAEQLGIEGAIISRLATGRIRGTRATREHTLAIIEWLHSRGCLDTVEEADRLLAAAEVAPLSEVRERDRRLLEALRGADAGADKDPVVTITPPGRENPSMGRSRMQLHQSAAILLASLITAVLVGGAAYLLLGGDRSTTDGTIRTATAPRATATTSAAPSVDPTPVVRATPILADAPTGELWTDSLLGAVGIPVRLEWDPVVEPDEGAEYQLQHSQELHGAWGGWGWVSRGITESSLDRELSPGTHRFRVRARSRGGEWGEWQQGLELVLAAHQETSPQIRYSGPWQTVSFPGFWGGWVRSSGAGGATASLRFTGRSVAWVTTRAPNRGRAEVRIDGRRVATVDLYSSAIRTGTAAFATSWDTAGTHTIEVRVLGVKHPASVDTYADVDAFVVLGSLLHSVLPLRA